MLVVEVVSVEVVMDELDSPWYPGGVAVEVMLVVVVDAPP